MGCTCGTGDTIGANFPGAFRFNALWLAPAQGSCEDYARFPGTMGRNNDLFKDSRCCSGLMPRFALAWDAAGAAGRNRGLDAVFWPALSVRL